MEKDCEMTARQEQSTNQGGIMTNWISVKERLPELGQKVWIKKDWHPLVRIKQPETVRICKGTFCLYPNYDPKIRGYRDYQTFSMTGSRYPDRSWQEVGLTHWHPDQPKAPEWGQSAKIRTKKLRKPYTWSEGGRERRIAAVVAANKHKRALPNWTEVRDAARERRKGEL